MSSPVPIDVNVTEEFVNQLWDTSVVPVIEKYISIPNQSPLFDPEWRENGYMQQVCDLFVDWVKAQNVPGLTLEVMIKE